MLADAEEVALSFENTNTDATKAVQTDRIRHPIALLCHLLFRSIAILLFLFSTLFFSNFITSFVTTIIFLSMDFWTVKNITGRLLVGLRWWNHVDDEGKSHWIYESRQNNPKDPNQLVVESTSEARIFWMALIVSQLIWSMFFIISLFTFKFKWLTIIVVAFTLNGSNLFGFLKCKFGSKQNLSNVASSYFGKQMLKSLFQRATSTVATDNNNNVNNSNNTNSNNNIQ